MTTNTPVYNWHRVRVFYRTMSDCKSKFVTVPVLIDTPDPTTVAVTTAMNKVRNQRGVYRLDTGEWYGLADPPESKRKRA